MATITVDNLSKTYQVHKKQPGVIGSVKDLFKREYREVVAVKNVSFLIEEGELVGFIGPNGAGKTTTLKILSGLLYPTRGKVNVLGHDPWKREYEFLRSISLVMGQKNQLWWDLPAIESYELSRDIYGIPHKRYKRVLDELVGMLGLEDKLHVQVRKLSLGERMKAELIAALIHTPKVLFLDEPTIGLDVVMQKLLREFIAEYNKKYGGSIILTSHYMDDVKELAKRVIIINKGELIFDGLLGDVISKFGINKIIDVSFSSPVKNTDLESISGFKSTTPTGAEFEVPRQKAASKSSEILQKLPVSDITVKEPELEDVIRTVFGNV